MPNNNGRRRARGGIRSGIRGTNPFTDTVLFQGTNNDLDGRNFTISELLPGLSDRQVVLRSMHIEFVPTFDNLQAADSETPAFQCSYVDVLGSADSQIPFEPYKLLSNVNPVSSRLNFVQMAKTIPTLRAFLNSERNVPVLNIRFEPLQITNGRRINARITTVVDVLPQQEVPMLS